MKKSFFLLLFLFFFSFVNAQITIRGKVIDSKNEPLVGASVYLNNTSIGTTTDDEGKFELTIKEGVYELIVSYLGYETLQYQLDTSTPNKPLTFKTKPSANLLDEIVLRNKKYSKKEREYFMSKFVKSFIGTTNFSKECKILNPKVISFNYDKQTRVLEAYVDEPIEILNKGLGYRIYYDLVHYKLSPAKINYLGYTRYIKLKGSKKKQKKWKKNRRRAYNGSQMHFIRSVMDNSFSKEGFIVYKSKKIVNPERPTSEVIKKTREYLKSLYDQSNGKKLNTGNQLMPEKINMSAEEFSKLSAEKKKKMMDSIFRKFKKAKNFKKATLNESLKFKRDSAMAIIRKSGLKPFTLVSTKDKLKQEDFIVKSNNSLYIKFKEYLTVRYTKEKEEDNYRRGSAVLKYQISNITLLTESVQLHKEGAFIKPLDVFVEGYWSYEKIADLLPLDYTLKE